MPIIIEHSISELYNIKIIEMSADPPTDTITNMLLVSARLRYDIQLFRTPGAHQVQNKLYRGLMMNEPFIVKCAHNTNAEQDIVDECIMMDSLRSTAAPNIIKRLMIPGLPVECLALPQYRYTLLELCSPALVYRVDDTARQLLLAGIASACRFLAERNVVHGDIKCDNIFVNLMSSTNDGTAGIGPAILADFGYAKHVTDIDYYDFIDCRKYAIQYAVGFQVCSTATMFITDMFQFILRPVFLLFGVQFLDDPYDLNPVIVKVGAGRIDIAPHDTEFPHYQKTLQYFTFISDIYRGRGSIPCIYPFVAPDEIKTNEFISTTMMPRISPVINPFRGLGLRRSRIMRLLLHALIRFPRNNSRKEAVFIWGSVINLCCDVSLWSRVAEQIV